MKPPYAYDHTPPHPSDITYTYTLAPRPDRLAQIALTYTFTFIEADETIFCWAQRNDGKLIGRATGRTKEDARMAARELAGNDFDKIAPQELPPIDTRGLKLA